VLQSGGNSDYHGADFSKLPNKDLITNTAAVSSPNFDPNPANNSASVKTLIFGHKPR
jgi:hypothetical protein